MQTSYFAKYKNTDGVNIAIKPAPGFTGPSYPALYPKWSFLKQYKIDGNEQTYTEAYYAQVLNHLDPQKVWDDLKDSTLLCWEKTGKFCHRRIVAKWLKDALNVDVGEAT
jgi:uncharacterized protein (DUF488 family)